MDAMCASERDTLERCLDAAARAGGFFAWGAARAAEVEDWPHYERYIAEGRHAGMAYLARHAALRRDPRLVMPEARSVLVFLRSYAFPPPPVPRRHGRVAAYARGLDYHPSLRRDLRAIAAQLPGARVRAFVDTGPILERYWARRAGLAALGKNTACLRRDAGSMFVIGILLTDVELQAAGAESADLCGSCRRCLDACPTGALRAPYELDARRCLAYLTIEHRGPLPPDLRAAAGDSVFGCDRCQDACPHNQRVQVPGHEDLRPRPPWSAPALADVLAWSEATYRDAVKDRALSRVSYEAMHRNVLMAAANTGAGELLERYRMRSRP
jgi:epoxyqueuosine reductase